MEKERTNNKLIPRAPAEENASQGQPGSKRKLTKNRAEEEVPETTTTSTALTLSKIEIRDITSRELKTAFEFLDEEGKGVITLQDMKKRLAALYGGPERVPMSELKFLMGSKKTLNFKQLRKILDETMEILTHSDIDPVYEAFKLYDPEQKGYADTKLISEMMERLGHGPIGEEDMKILVETIDSDGDGKISLNDFKEMLSNNTKKSTRYLT